MVLVLPCPLVAASQLNTSRLCKGLQYLLNQSFFPRSCRISVLEIPINSTFRMSQCCISFSTSSFWFKIGLKLILCYPCQGLLILMGALLKTEMGLCFLWVFVSWLNEGTQKNKHRHCVYPDLGTYSCPSTPTPL